MLTYSFKNTDGESMYEYLYRCIRDDIMDRKIKAGEKLPSKRVFAKNLDVSTITVENAYAQLAAEGYIYSIPKKGYFVSEIDEDYFNQDTASDKPSITSEPRTEYTADFANNSIAHELFPFSVWTKLLREITSSESRSHLLVSSSPSGVLPLRQAIAKHLYEFRGMQVDAEQIIIGAGTEYLYSLIIQLLGRDRVFGLEDPGYTRLNKIYTSNGAGVRHIPMDGNGIIIHALEETDVDIMHVSPSHHYPTGISIPINRRYELLGWAAGDSNRYIIEDDYDCEFRLYGKPIPTLQSIDVMDKVIYINTFSKSLAPSFRISYMVLPKSLIEIFREKLGFYSCTVSTFEQYTLAEFINRGYFEKHINRMRNFYRNKQNAIIQQLKSSCIAPFISIHQENEGLHFLLKINADISDTQLEAQALDKGIKITCLSEFYESHECSEHSIVLNYSGIDSEIMEKSIRLLIDCIAGELNIPAGT